MHRLFDLSGNTAIVTGCNTGLGQGMALALAEAGADIVGVNRSDASATRAGVEAAGRRYVDVAADLSSIADIPAIVARSVSAFGRIDILVNNAGIIRRADALEFTERDWDDVMDVNLKTVFFLSQGWPGSSSRRAQAARSSTSHRCSRFRAASACRRTRRRKAAWSD